MQAVAALVRKQLLEIASSFQLRALTLVAPLFQFILFGFAFNFDVEKVKLAVLDFDRTATSRDFTQNFTRSKYFVIAAHLNDYAEADDVLLNGKARLVLVIPPNFGNSILAGKQVQVQTLIDGADGNTANIASGYASGVVSSYSQRILMDVQSRLPEPPKLPTVSTETRIWYNPDLKSRNFFVPSIIALMIMVGTVIASSTSIVKERELGTLEQLIVSPVKPYQIVIGKLAPFLATAAITTLNLLVLSALIFGVTMRGNLLLFFLLTLGFVATLLGLGLFVSTISKTQQQASFTTAFFILPPFLFLSGYAFPIEAMPEWIQPVTYIIPLRYFIVIVRGIFLKGNGLAELWDESLLLLLCGAVIFTASFLRFKKNLE